jgi:hypothetical protein
MPDPDVKAATMPVVDGARAALIAEREALLQKGAEQ